MTSTTEIITTRPKVRLEVRADLQYVRVTPYGRGVPVLPRWIDWTTLHECARQSDPEAAAVYRYVLEQAQAQFGGPAVMQATRDLARALLALAELPERFHGYAYTEAQRKRIRSEKQARETAARQRGGHEKLYPVAGVKLGLTRQDVYTY